MHLLVVAVAMCTTLLVTTAHAQTVRRPTELPQGPTGVPGGGPGSSGQQLGTTNQPLDLKGSVVVPTPAPQVQKQVAPPPAARAGPPDAGDASACECYRMEFVETIGRDGRMTRQQFWRATGTKSLACCRR